MTVDEIDRNISDHVARISAGKASAADWSRLHELSEMRAERLIPGVFRKSKEIGR